MPTAAMAMLGSSGIGAVRMAAHSLDLEGANIEERKRPLLAAIFVAGGRSSPADAVWLLVRFGTLVVDGETEDIFRVGGIRKPPAGDTVFFRTNETVGPTLASRISWFSVVSVISHVLPFLS
jgi:hypothetical protein